MGYGRKVGSEWIRTRKSLTTSINITFYDFYISSSNLQTFNSVWEKKIWLKMAQTCTQLFYCQKSIGPVWAQF